MSRLIFSLMLLCSAIQATNPAPANPPTAQDPGDKRDQKAESENGPTNPTLKKIWDLIQRVKSQGSNVNATLLQMSNKISLDNNSKDSSIIIKLDNLMQELNNWTKNVIGIQAQDKASRDFIDEIKKLNKEISNAMRGAEKQFRDIKTGYENLVLSIQSNQTTIAANVEISRGLAAQLNQLDQELTSYQQKSDDAKTSLEGLQDDIDHLKNTIAGLNEEIKAKEALIKSNNETMADINADIGRKQKERNQLSQQVQTLRTSLSKVQELFQKNTNELFAKRTDLGNLAKDLLAAKTEETSLTQQIKNRQSSIEELNTRSTVADIELQKGALSQIKNNIDLLRNTLKEVNQRNDQARASFEIRSKALTNLQNENKAAMQEANQIEGAIAEMQQGGIILGQEKINQDKAIEQAQDALKKTQEQLRQLKVQQATNEATRNSAVTEFNERRKELERINGEISKLEGEIYKAIVDITRSHDSLKSNNSSEVNKYDDAAMKFEGSIGRINISLKSLGERLSLFKQSIQQIKDRNETAAAQREATTNALRPKSQSQVE